MPFIGNQPTAVPLTSADLNDGIITTAKIANDAVNASKFDETDNYSFTGTITGAGESNTPTWFVTRDALQSLSNNVWTQVTFNVEEVDTNNAFASNTFTVPSGQAGKYFAFGQIRFDTPSTFSYINVRIVHNSTDVVSAWNANNAGGYTTINTDCIVNLAEGDTLKLYARQQSGTSQNIGFYDGGHTVYFGGYKITT